MPTWLEISRRFTEKYNQRKHGGTPMRQVKYSPRPRIGAYTAETIAEALRLKMSGLTPTKISHVLGIPQGSIARILRVALRGHENVRAEEYAAARKLATERILLPANDQELDDEQPPSVEQLQVPKALADFFDWLVKRAYAAEAELMETQKLLADKTAEADRAWAEVNAHAKTDISRELAAVYEEYKTSQSSWQGGR